MRLRAPHQGPGAGRQRPGSVRAAAAATSRSQVGRKGGQSHSYDDWSKQDLVRRAREIGIKRIPMNLPSMSICTPRAWPNLGMNCVYGSSSLR